MIKKLNLTEDHLKLIRGLRFEKFTFGDKFDVTRFNDAITDVDKAYKAADDKMSEAFGEALSSLLRAQRKVEALNDNANHYAYGVDQWSLWGGNYVLEDIARLIGRYDEVIPETIGDRLGAQFPEETTKYMLGLYQDIVDNLGLIIALVFQFSTEGGLTPGTYKCIDYEGVWEKI